MNRLVLDKTVGATHKVRPRPRRQITHNLSRITDQLKRSLLFLFGSIEVPFQSNPKLF